MITVYGIRQCDTCRKALRWLEAESIEHRFHDLRADGLDAARVESWLASPFAAQIVNRRSTTWRGLTEAQKQMAGKALAGLLLANPTLVKRPVFTVDGEIVAVGFDTTTLAARLSV